MKIKVTKQTIEDAHWWLAYTGEQCQDIEDLYQATQIMVTQLKSQTKSHGGYSGRSSSSSSGWFSSTHTEGSHSGSIWNKSDTAVDCDYIELDFRLAAKVSKLSSLYNSTSKTRWNASVVSWLKRKGYSVGFKDFVSASSYASSSSLYLGLQEIVRLIKQNSFQPADNYSNLVEYKKMMEDFCAFDYSRMDEPYPGESCWWAVPHKHNGFKVMVRCEHGGYFVHINMHTVQDVGVQRVYECVSLDVCKKVIQETAFKLMPVLLSADWRSVQVLVENEIEGLYV